MMSLAAVLGPSTPSTPTAYVGSWKGSLSLLVTEKSVGQEEEGNDE